MDVNEIKSAHVGNVNIHSNSSRILKVIHFVHVGRIWKITLQVILFFVFVPLTKALTCTIPFRCEWLHVFLWRHIPIEAN